MHKRTCSSLSIFLLAGTFLTVNSSVYGQKAANPESLKLGEAAPNVALSNIEGKRVHLKDYRGKKNVALVFYPALFRPGGG